VARLDANNPIQRREHIDVLECVAMERGDWGWASDVETFLSIDRDVWMRELEAHHRDLMGVAPSGSQTKAWHDEHHAMRIALRDACVALPDDAPRWGVIFEYELPLEGGRRPDVVVLAGSTIVVLEFKSSALPAQADVDQVAAYARDLADYHAESHGHDVIPLLVLQSSAPGFASVIGDVTLTAPEGITSYLLEHADGPQLGVEGWVNSRYEPLPTLVEAARRIFQHEPLPHVTYAIAARLPETVELLGELADRASTSSDRIMAFVTGVPGAGKTLVGLRLVYERTAKYGRAATFLSGNGPLVLVLQDALQSKVFVRDLHAYIRSHALLKRPKDPEEHVIVFDEAQRAWDRHYMELKKDVAKSEPELLVGIGERVPEWCALVGLVGEGQEIYSGEEGGIAQWAEAARPPLATVPWRVHCPPKLADAFTGVEVETHDLLNLEVSLRSRRADELHSWVRLLLAGSISLAHRQHLRLAPATFPMYVSRDLEEAKAYARSRYDPADETKRYGLVASSQAKNLEHYGVENGFQATKRTKIARWFNDPPASPLSCCALDQPVTEFQCQGLELDLPILCWGTDLMWGDGQWKLTPARRKYPLTDPEQLLVNTYRVLLTRGRDGLVVWIPDARALDPTEHILLAAGLRHIPEPEELAATV
jgi:hypothetical protein